MENLTSNQALRGLDERSTGYLSKDTSENDIITALQAKYNIEKMHRFDVGKNTDGFSPIILEALSTPKILQQMTQRLIDYPDTHYHTLRRQLALRFNLPEEHLLLSAGIESFVDMISRVLLHKGDRYLLPAPNFYLFEEISNKTGATPYVIPLSSLRWTNETTENIIKAYKEQAPKLLWISNPINPTGQFIPHEHLQQIITQTNKSLIIVVDEAYGECTDSDSGYISAAKFVSSTPNLIVLRTFSKLYGLAGARVGYMICSSPLLRKAVHYYRQYFPLSLLSLYLAQLATLDDAYLCECRGRIIRRKNAFLNDTKILTDFQFLPSSTNTIMFKHKLLEAKTLFLLLAQQGILTANISGVTGIKDEHFLRMTLRTHHDNSLFIEKCKNINNSKQLNIT